MSALKRRCKHVGISRRDFEQAQGRAAGCAAAEKRKTYLAKAVQTGYHGSGIGVGGKFILQGPVGLLRTEFDDPSREKRGLYERQHVRPFNQFTM